MLTICEELEKLRTYCEECPPANEAETCHWAILPLIEACGYAKFEIGSQKTDGAGKYPDYTVLWNTPDKWYLEAKAWREKLSDEHVNQAIYSAYSTGQRWVVLSNGKEWRLYDARILGSKPSDRLVFTAHLNNGTAMEELLTALRKESVTSKAIEQFAEQARLRMIIENQLSDSSSVLLRKMAEVLKRELGVSNASPDSVKAVLESRHQQAAAAPAIEENAASEADQRTYAAPVPVAPSTVAEDASALGEPMYLLTPVKDEPGYKVRDPLETLIGNGWYVFGEGTTGRKKLKPGDKIAF
ncbi:MAG: hypothetical protein H0W86_08820 [Armatimonadetes bacterium]|nr:hypothetical protein [Armatimonadota bacterium]